MRQLLLLLCLLPMWALAQIPDGYYTPAEGTTGDALKEALYNIIKGHKAYSYSAVWNILKESDRDPENPSNVILLYAGVSFDASKQDNGSNSNDVWNREHVWAKSHGDFGTSAGAGTDCHHLRPANRKINSDRSNYFFEKGGIAVDYNGIPTGCYLNKTGYTFEPRDAVKGDVARMIMYMAVRYEGENGEPDLELSETIDKSNKPLMGVKSTLLKWNLQDPVDDFERNRNEVVYGYQKNRNPFIDHPEYATAIWGSTTSVNNPAASSYGAYLSNGALTITANTAIFKVEILSITGQTLFINTFNSDNSVSINASQLTNGICIVVINGEKAIKVVK